MNMILIAQIVHALIAGLGRLWGVQAVSCEWGDTSEAYQAGLIAGVTAYFENPELTPAQEHQTWLDAKLADGWVVGAVLDTDNKVHPLLLPFDELPIEHRSRAIMLHAAVHALKGLPYPDETDVQALHDQIAHLQKAVVEKSTGVSGSASGRSMTEISGTAVKYIGRRPHWDDGIYSSGLSFAADQVRVLPPEIARKLLRHCDLFEQADQSGLVQDNTGDLLAAGEKIGAKRDESEVEFAVIDQVNRMEDRDVLVEFAQNRFNLKLAKTKKPETMRAEIIAHINRFGVV
jgi:hypothetical protein